MKPTECYKLVYGLNDGTLLSINALLFTRFGFDEMPQRKPCFILDYAVGKFTKADPEAIKNGFGLVAFDTINNARIFKNAMDGYKLKLYKAIGFSSKYINNDLNKKSPKIIPSRLEHIGSKLALIQQMKMVNETFIDYAAYTYFPTGSIMFSSIKLIEEIIT